MVKQREKTKSFPHIIIRVTPEDHEEIHKTAVESGFGERGMSSYLRWLHKQYLKNKGREQGRT